jgi:CO/xanthine dehydrogenase Mo-binding subunit
MVGLAVFRASQDLLEQLKGIVGRRWRCPGQVEYVDGRYLGPDGQSASVDEAREMLASSSDELIGRGRVGIGDDPVDFPVFWEACAASATVAIDEANGRVRVLQVVTAPDVGRALNPQLVEIQDFGCTLQAVGQTLFEQLEHGPTGELLSPSLAQYQVPTTELAPLEMISHPIENADGPGPFGAKGCGEGPFGCVPAAIVTGLAEAGAPLVDLPATPERVWIALRATGAS